MKKTYNSPVVAVSKSFDDFILLSVEGNGLGSVAYFSDFS